jgi:hypothetical protein
MPQKHKDWQVDQTYHNKHASQYRTHMGEDDRLRPI